VPIEPGGDRRRVTEQRFLDAGYVHPRFGDSRGRHRPRLASRYSKTAYVLPVLSMEHRSNAGPAYNGRTARPKSPTNGRSGEESSPMPPRLLPSPLSFGVIPAPARGPGASRRVASRRHRGHHRTRWVGSSPGQTQHRTRISFWCGLWSGAHRPSRQTVAAGAHTSCHALLQRVDRARSESCG
jgi:hypothetical protein